MKLHMHVLWHKGAGENPGKSTVARVAVKEVVLPSSVRDGEVDEAIVVVVAPSATVGAAAIGDDRASDDLGETGLGLGRGEAGRQQ